MMGEAFRINCFYLLANTRLYIASKKKCSIAVLNTLLVITSVHVATFTTLPQTGTIT